MASSRKSRSDAGILSLSRALLQNVMGLNAQTTAKVMKLIRNSGQLQDLKQNMRGMNSMAYRRINQVVDVVIKDAQKKNKGGKKEGNQDEEKAAQKKAVNESFINYLLSEIQMDSETIRTDPQAKKDAIKLTRANDAQAVSLEKRMGREKLQRDRKSIADESDPKKKAQRRQIMQREKQLQGLKDEVSGKDPNAPDDAGGATM